MSRHLPVLLAALSAVAHGQSAPPPPTLIVGKAELLNTLKTANLKPGDLFYLRTLGPWQQGDCTIPSHTTITGHVESLTSTTTRPAATILALRFSEIPCSGSTSALMTPLLVSIKAPDPDSSYNAGAPQTPTLSGIFPTQVNAGRTQAGPARQPNIPTGNTAGASQALDANEMNQLHDAPGKPMKTGEVRGYRGIALTLPGREGPAAKLSSEHRITLDRAAEFAFAYAPTPPPSPSPDTTPATAAPPVTTPAPATPPPPPPAEPAEIEDVCASSGCKQLAAVAQATSAHAIWTLPLAALGYQSRPQQRIAGLDHSASVHFLGDDQILLTFTRHVLLPRSSDKDAWAVNPRVVRAVLISRADGRVLRVNDWTVSDDIAPFVWGLSNGVVIAHVGHDLVRFGPGLTIQRRFRLPGPLLFLSASPSGNLLLVATVHEKHTEKEHAQIASFVGPDVPIDEEYDLTGLDAAFHVTGAKRVTVPPLRPALLQASIVRVQPGARPAHTTDWLLEENSWEGHSKPLAHFRSICPLQVQSFPGDLLFVQGCSPLEARTTWYRVLNARGATLFKGSGPYSDFIQQTESTDDGRLFAIASSHFNRPVDRTTPLLTGDFTNLTVTIYDSTTGKQFFAAHLPQGSAQEDTFSLAPSGSALAVLTSASLQLFPLPAATKK
ncbi:MAG TPA: hypothetical protein VGU25_16600 [Acidobacteriaceae bacterium]|nr:hypothetical protein [Acidobacteriaceae bacterium]